MGRATLKGILAQKLRLLLTGLAIVIGVGFITGTYVFGDTMNKAFDNLFAGIYSKTDVVVRGTSIVSDEDRPSFSEDVLARVPSSSSRTATRSRPAAAPPRASPGTPTTPSTRSRSWRASRPRARARC
jgi:putative ABC transport system permease protein